MPTRSHNANGHRRRQLRARVLAEETHCALCHQPVNTNLRNIPGHHGPRCTGNCTGCTPHPKAAVIDEDLPRSRGGSPYARDNCHLMHRACNQAKGTMTIAEYKARTGTTPPPRQDLHANTLITW